MSYRSKYILLAVWLSSVSLFASLPAQAVDIASSGDLPLYSKIYDPKRDAFADAKAAIRLAAATERNVLIEIGGNWCTWCEKIDNFLIKNPDIYQALHSNFVLLKVNVSDANENAEFMASFPKVLGYPHMYVSTAQGKVILSKDTAEFLDQSGSDYSRQAWLNFISTFQAANNLANLRRFEIDKLSKRHTTN